VSRWDRPTLLYFYLGALALWFSLGRVFFPVALGIFITPLVATIVRRRIVRRKFKNEWLTTHGLTTSPGGASQTSTIVFPPDPTGQEESQHLTAVDSNIVETVRVLSTRLGILFPVHLVRWLPPRLPSDICVFGLFDPDEIDLPWSLRGKLDEEELMPLIASSMIYEFKLERRRAFGLLARALGSLSLLTFFVIFLAIAFTGTFGLPFQAIAGTLALIFLILPIGLSQWLGARLRQKQRLEADKLAASAVGKELLLRTLGRIDALGLRDIEKLKRGGWKTHFAKDPSITRRIEELSASD